MIRSTKRGSALVAAIGICLALLLAAGFFYIQYQTLRMEKNASSVPVKRTITADVQTYQPPQADASADSEVPLDHPAEEDSAVQQAFAADAPDVVAPVEPRSDLDGNGPPNARQVGAIAVKGHFNLGFIVALGVVVVLVILLLLMAAPKQDQQQGSCSMMKNRKNSVRGDVFVIGLAIGFVIFMILASLYFYQRQQEPSRLEPSGFVGPAQSDQAQPTRIPQAQVKPLPSVTEPLQKTGQE